MTRSELHEIAVRRQGDPDVKALLLEIKRLRTLVVESYQAGTRLVRYTEDSNAAEAMERFTELFEDEPAILEAFAPPEQAPAKPETEGDRAAKRLERQKRG